MESIISAFIIVTIIIFAALTLFQAAITAQDDLQVAWQEMAVRQTELAHTDLSLVNTETKSSGAVVEITLRNDGDTKLADFENWDLIAQTYSASDNYAITWLPYTLGEPNSNEWSVAGIYLDAGSLEAEQYEPDILNPGEELLLRLRVLPPVGVGNTNMITLATDNGFHTSILFTR